MVDKKKRKPWIHLAFISSYPRKTKERCWFPPTSWLLESLKLEMWMVGWCRMCGSRPKFLKPPSSEGKFQGIYLSTTSTNRMNDSNLVTTSVQAQRLDFTSQKLGAFTVLLNKSKVFFGGQFCEGSLCSHSINFLGHLESNIWNTPPPRTSSSLQGELLPAVNGVIPPINGLNKMWHCL